MLNGRPLNFRDPDGRNRRICQYYNRGSCQKGSACNFLHLKESGERRDFPRGSCRKCGSMKHQAFGCLEGRQWDVLTGMPFDKSCTGRCLFMYIAFILDSIPEDKRTQEELEKGPHHLANLVTAGSAFDRAVDEMIRLYHKADASAEESNDFLVWLWTMCRQSRHRAEDMAGYLMMLFVHAGWRVGQPRRPHRFSRPRESFAQWTQLKGEAMRGDCGCERRACQTAKALANTLGIPLTQYYKHMERSFKLAKQTFLVLVEVKGFQGSGIIEQKASSSCTSSQSKKNTAPSSGSLLRTMEPGSKEECEKQLSEMVQRKSQSRWGKPVDSSTFMSASKELKDMILNYVIIRGRACLNPTSIEELACLADFKWVPAPGVTEYHTLPHRPDYPRSKAQRQDYSFAGKTIILPARQSLGPPTRLYVASLEEEPGGVKLNSLVGVFRSPKSGDDHVLLCRGVVRYVDESSKQPVSVKEIGSAVRKFVHDQVKKASEVKTKPNKPYNRFLDEREEDRRTVRELASINALNLETPSSKVDQSRSGAGSGTRTGARPARSSSSSTSQSSAIPLPALPVHREVLESKPWPVPRGPPVAKGPPVGKGGALRGQESASDQVSQAAHLVNVVNPVEVLKLTQGTKPFLAFIPLCEDLKVYQRQMVEDAGIVMAGLQSAFAAANVVSLQMHLFGSVYYGLCVPGYGIMSSTY